LLTYARFHRVDPREARRRADDVLARFQMAGEADRKVMDLSGGQRRRVQVAKVFMVDTPVVFMDEFSTGMDPILKRALMELLRAEARRGRTIVLTTQVLTEAEELCDDILIMNRGRQVARGDLNALKTLTTGIREVCQSLSPAGRKVSRRSCGPSSRSTSASARTRSRSDSRCRRHWCWSS